MLKKVELSAGLDNYYKYLKVIPHIQPVEYLGKLKEIYKENCGHENFIDVSSVLKSLLS